MASREVAPCRHSRRFGSTRARAAKPSTSSTSTRPDLMDGDVEVRISHSTINYKDGLAITGRSPVVRRFPMIPGIDFAGIIERSSHPAFGPGDAVVLNGLGTRRDAPRRLRPAGTGQGRLAGAAAARLHARRGHGDRHRGLHGPTGRAGARAARADPERWPGGGHGCCGRGRHGGGRAAGYARLARHRHDRTARAGGLPQGPRRGRDRRPG